MKSYYFNSTELQNVLSGIKTHVFIPVRDNCKYFRKWSDDSDIASITGISMYRNILSPLGLETDIIAISEDFLFDKNQNKIFYKKDDDFKSEKWNKNLPIFASRFFFEITKVKLISYSDLIQKDKDELSSNNDTSKISNKWFWKISFNLKIS